MKYTKDFLDEALSQLQTPDYKERKRVATVFMRAACKELGTKDTKPIKEWFLINQEAFFSSIAEETEPETSLHLAKFLCSLHPPESFVSGGVEFYHGRQSPQI